MERIRALYGDALIAALQGDLPAATARVAEGRRCSSRWLTPRRRA